MQVTNVIRTQSLQSSGYLFFEKFASAGSSLKNLTNFSSLERFKKFPTFKSKKAFVYLILLIILIIGGFWFFKSKPAPSDVSEATYVAQGQRVGLNKSFTIAIRTRDGKETGQGLVVNVTFLERTDKILFKGRQLVAREGKDFLVINLEVENPTNNRLTVRPVDFYRLIDDSGKSYAADIQTEDIKVQPQSSKKTRVIYIIGDNQKNIKLVIGEIRGDNKETIEVAI